MRRLQRLLIGTILLSLIPGLLRSQNSRVELQKFDLQSTVVIAEDGARLSSADYEVNNYWFPVDVPGTVLSGLVANKVYPSPYFGLNNMRIPDANDSTNRAYNLSQYSHLPNHDNPWKDPYWYRTSFDLPESYSGKHIWLHFKGINYRAEVWLNGEMIVDSTGMVGMFKEYRFEVTDFASTDHKNNLAVKIFPLDYPGLPSPPQLDALGPFYPNGGPTGDIGKNVTMLCSVGWDWMPAVRDRGMGIWQPVFLSHSGPVTIDDPQVISELPNLPDTSRAGLIMKMKLANHTDRTQRGRLHLSIQPKNFEGEHIEFSRSENIKGKETKTISLNYEAIHHLRIDNPRLWWPNGYGRPNLYDLVIRYETEGAISHQQKVTFGIRTIRTEVVDVNGWPRRDFYMNSKRIHLTGGAWVPDLMLQRDSLRYAREMSLIENANLNTVRIWGGGIAPPDEFYKQADRRGLMIWQDFWITGDTQGEFKGSPDWPLEGEVFIENMISTIKRIRNHPALLLWTGGNEGHARRELYEAMRRGVAELDGTRPFIPSSSGFAELPEGWKGSWPDDRKSGVYSGGPYSWQEPERYYELVDAGRDWVWKDETGLPSQVTYGSLPKVIPNLVPDTTELYPLNSTWGYHDAASGNGKYETYYQAIADRYGTPQGYRDYSDKSQLVNANGYRAIFEAVGSKLSETGGVLLWKLNAAFPSVIWQLYDWYLNPNAGYYFTKRAVEPIHVQLNLNDSTVAVVNRQYRDRDDLKVHMRLYNGQLDKEFDRSSDAKAPAYRATEVYSLASVLKSFDALTIVELTLINSKGKRLSSNVYWLAPDDNYRLLQDLPSASLNISYIKPKPGEKDTWQIRLENPSEKLAFFVNPKITTKDGEEVQPSYWSDNYFSIAPGDAVSLEVSIRDAQIADQLIYLSVDGLNIQAKMVEIP